MQNLSANIGVQIKPIFQSDWPNSRSKREQAPYCQQSMVYKFACYLCDADYVGYTARHLHQLINEHKYSAIGRHLEQHGLSKADLVDKQFSVLKKCRSKLDCLIFETLFIKELNPELNTQKDYSRQTLYMTLCANTSLQSHIFAFVSFHSSLTLKRRHFLNF